MDDYKLMMAKMRGDELMRKAERDRRAAAVRRARRTRQTVPAVRGLVIRLARRLAMATARMRPSDNGTVIRTR